MLDNPKAAMINPDRYDPTFQRTFEEYARVRKLVIDPAPPGSPTCKPTVDRGVPYVRENFFRGESYRKRQGPAASNRTSRGLR